MVEQSIIAWTTHTFNPWMGCPSNPAFGLLGWWSEGSRWWALENLN